MHRIVSVSISDTLGTNEAKFSPKSLTLISGANGSGKSSLLSALKYVFDGGSSPEIIRRGTTKSIVSFTLNTGHVITKTTFAKKNRAGEPNGFDYRLEVLSPDGLPVPAPMSFVTKLSEAVAVDPGAILKIDTGTIPGRKQLAELLLRLMPIEFSPEEIASVIGAEYRPGAEVRILDVKALALPEPPAVAADLDGLKKYFGLVTEQRRRVGIVKEEAGGSANDLRRSLPDGTQDPAALAAEMETAEEWRREVESAIAERRLGIERDKSAAMAGCKDLWSRAVNGTNADIDAKIEQLKAERDRLNNGHRAERDRGESEINRLTAIEIASLETESKPQLEQAIGNVSRLKEVHNNSAKAIVLREQIEKAETKARDHAIKYDQLSEILSRLDKMRRDKLDSLPVPGVEIADGDVSVDGVPWRLVNTAKRVTVALQLCCLRAGEGGFLLVDNAEALDPETTEWIRRGAIAGGFQLFEARLSNTCAKCGHEHPSSGLEIAPCNCGCEQFAGEPLRIETHALDTEPVHA